MRAADGRILWQTPLARQLLGAHQAGCDGTPAEPVLDWLQAQAVVHATGGAQAFHAGAPWPAPVVKLHEASAASGGESGGEDEWLLVMSESSGRIDHRSAGPGLQAHRAKPKCCIAVQGKTNRDIGEIPAPARARCTSTWSMSSASSAETHRRPPAWPLKRVRQLAAGR